MYIADKSLKESFQRLRYSKPAGKAGIERTSALMYFLAFDALVSQVIASGSEVVDMNPHSVEGKHNRDQFVAQFLNLVVISKTPASHFKEFGEVTTEGPRPEERISNNFLTTPLKRASQSAEPKDYPSRPSPLLILGVAAKGSQWGVTRHAEWTKNLVTFLADTNSFTPFTDLAVVLSRRLDLPAGKNVNHADLAESLKALFSDELVAVWTKHLVVESRRSACPQISVQPSESRVLCLPMHRATTQSVRVGKVTDGARIRYLEKLLTQNGIPFDKEDQ
jgi:hypothetical protein